MIKKILLASCFLGMTSLTAHASSVDREEEPCPKTRLRPASSPAFPITPNYLSRLVFDTTAKMLSIFDDNIRVGGGTSEARLTAKLMFGYVNMNQLSESSIFKSAGKLVTKFAGNDLSSQLGLAYPEAREMGFAFGTLNRPGYLGYTLTAIDKAIGGLVINVLKNPNPEKIQIEIEKFIKAQATAVGVAMAGHYYQMSYTPQFTYQDEEFYVASHMAMGGALGFFFSSLFVDLSRYALQVALQHPLPYSKEFRDVIHTPYKAVTRVTAQTQAAARAANEQIAEVLLPTVRSSMNQAQTLAYGAMIQASYEFGGIIGDVLYTFNSCISVYENPSEREATRQTFGAMAATLSAHTFHSAKNILSFLSF